MTLAFIVNPASGKGRKIFNQFKHKLTIPYRTYITSYSGHATKIVKHLVKEEKITLIIVVGGDGTIHEVLNGIGTHAITLGVIKNGSGNDYGRYFKTFEHPKEVVRFIKHPKQAQVDVLKVKHGNFSRLMMNNSGIGFDALVCEYVNRSRMKKILNKLHLGRFVYPYYVIKALKTFQPFSITVSINGETTLYERVWFVTVSNQPYFGGGMKIAPHAKANDQLLDVTVVHSLDAKTFLKMFWLVYRGKHLDLPYVSQEQARTVSVQLKDRMVCHSDGEAYYMNGHFPVEYTVLPHHLRLAEPMRRK